MSIHAVIFDLDGTLADTAGEIALALNRTLEELRQPTLSPVQVSALVGRGVRSLVERALPPESARDLDAAVERFESHYANVIATEATLFPNTLGGLARLRAAGFAMSVVTNKPRYFTLRLLDRLAIAELFSVVVAGDDGIPRKPRGDMLLAACREMGSVPGSSLMVGDSDNDVLAARAAGCRVWCVPYGYNEGRAPDTLQCDRIVATVDEAAGLIIGETQ
jgi:phosphoglycolate phosphatase